LTIACSRLTITLDSVTKQEGRNKLKKRVFSVLAAAAMLTALLSTGGLVVYADSHADAHATANSEGVVTTEVYACHDAYAEAAGKSDNDSSSAVDNGYTNSTPGTAISYAYAEATSVGGGYADSDVYVYVGNDPYAGKINGYAISNAQGTDSYANSDINIEYVIPAGVYFDVDANGNAVAIALLLSDGSTVWGFAYTNAANGDGAVAFVDTDDKEEGIRVEAIVGQISR
jgi:hypothetical protein